ncbi:GNAT family N-acetyltransferase [Undibacterium sp. Jales W-56]|uniref:GNAT family N-acetyltransferase n=1 Tax=Undibacterium sp. Jales W-56 TaxID=2897325 RepID=UPI0021D26E8D|nr:GNAT family N-acetyltransferase [Undibacterium sp. Jales W-56]MCU6432994.1 GNAT family N-acetyltransferase [Undibacterium sp. Jales W-56]
MTVHVAKVDLAVPVNIEYQLLNSPDNDSLAVISQHGRIDLCAATAEDLPRIENMMQFYNYDFSEWHKIELSDTGLFELQPKAAYWSRNGVKPFLIKVNDALAGFAVLDDELVDNASDYNLGYFFILRGYRGKGISQLAIQLLLERFQGRWEIYCLRQNLVAEKFWRKTLASVLGYAVISSEVRIHDEDCRLFNFSSKKITKHY